MLRDSREAVRRGVFSEIESEAFREAFGHLRRQAEALHGFASAGKLIEFLHSPSPGESERKNPVLHALICAAQSPEDPGRNARTLLLAAMWPALEHSFFRLLAMLSNTGDPFAEVYWAFLEEVQHWNPAKSSRVAANLQRNTEKRVRRAVREEQEHKATCRRLGELGTYRPAPRGEEGALSDDDRQEAAGVLASLVDQDVISLEESLLLVGHALYGRELSQMAAEQKLSREAVWKRYQRAARKVRGALRRSKVFLKKGCPVEPQEGLLAAERSDDSARSRGGHGGESDEPGIR